MNGPEHLIVLAYKGKAITNLLSDEDNKSADQLAQIGKLPAVVQYGSYSCLVFKGFWLHQGTDWFYDESLSVQHN
jgi:hypothetical protein